MLFLCGGIVMDLYKVLVDGAEFLNYAYQEFTVIAMCRQNAIEIVYRFVSGKIDNIPDYLEKEKLKVEYIGTMSNVKIGYENEVISYVYK
jgi:hypothetical protein